LTIALALEPERDQHENGQVTIVEWAKHIVPPAPGRNCERGRPYFTFHLPQSRILGQSFAYRRARRNHVFEGSDGCRLSADRETPTLLERCARNPILTARDWPYSVHSVFNPGAVRLADGTTLLLCRVEDRRGMSHLCAARSHDGISGWSIDTAPTLIDTPNEACWGIEDPRITYVPELSRYAITYTGITRSGAGVCLALTEDFRQFESLGFIMQPNDRDAALLPRKIDGKFAVFHRPASATAAHIWVSYSRDLRNWDHPQPVLKARDGSWWDAQRVGLAPPLLETGSGWLMLYHGVRQGDTGCVYRVGTALLSLDDPTRCLARGDSWILGPESPYERVGDANNVVFPCGFTLGNDGDELRIYYGAANSCIGMATGSVKKLLSFMGNGEDQSIQQTVHGSNSRT